VRLGLLQCDHVNPELLDIAGDYDAMFSRLFEDYADEVSLRVYDVGEGIFPASLAECDAYLISGSRRSVFEDEPWIARLEALVRELQEARRPLVGVCFGHQLIAQALGGRVERSLRGWGVGVKAMKVREIRPWMRPPLGSYQLLVSHQDQVVTLPAGTRVLAGNDHCPYGMMLVVDHFLGIQAHPEFTPAFAGALLAARASRLGDGLVAAARVSLTLPLHRREVTSWMVRFLREGVG